MVEFSVARTFWATTGQQKCLKNSKQAQIRERKAYSNYIKIKEKQIQGKQKTNHLFPDTAHYYQLLAAACEDCDIIYFARLLAAE